MFITCSLCWCSHSSIGKSCTYTITASFQRATYIRTCTQDQRTIACIDIVVVFRRKCFLQAFILHTGALYSIGYSVTTGTISPPMILTSNTVAICLRRSSPNSRKQVGILWTTSRFIVIIIPGIERTSLQLVWDFTTASVNCLTERYTLKPLNKGHTWTVKNVLYPEVKFYNYVYILYREVLFIWSVHYNWVQHNTDVIM